MRMGTAMERAGLSTDCTNTVDESLCKHSGISEGFWMESITAGMKGLMSLFSQVFIAERAAAVAASLTSFLVSHIAAEIAGKALFKKREKGTGERSARIAMYLRPHILVCQEVDSTAEMSHPMTVLIPCKQTFSMMALPASSAAVRTSAFFLSAMSSRILGRKGTMKDSALVVSASMMFLMAIKAPSAVARSSMHLPRVWVTSHSA
mmetsp:Transcript_33469/g.52079  ORF Transcript_33469/g.52079 Transcript_33469/m.52079 type:complete len:206 (-) Transcript_33469:4-621(-)